MGNANDLLNFLNTQESQRTGKAVKPIQPKFPKTFTPVGKAPAGGRFVLPNTAHLIPPAPAHHGGGGVGGALHSIGSFFGGAAHDAAHYSDLAAHDIAAMPAGFVKGGQALSHDAAKLGNMIPGASSTYTKRADKTPWETPALGKAMAEQTYNSVRHPLRDPFQGLLTAAAIASLGLGGVARAGAAGDAMAAAEDAGALGKAGAAAKAFAKKPVMPVRYLKVPKNILTKDGAKVMRTEKVQLMHSNRPLPRALQTLHDRIVEHSLNKTNVENPSLIYKYGASRVGKATSEVARRSDRVRMTLPFELDKIKKFDKPLSRQEGNLALMLRSANVTPAEISDYWASRVNHPDTENPALMHHMAELAFNLHQKGALSMQDGNLVINKAAFPRLHAADKLIKEAQGIRENIITKHDLLSPETMNQRLDLVARTIGVDRKGQGYTFLGSSRKSITPYPRAGSTPVTGGLKNFIPKKKIATGRGIQQGVVPDNTAAGVAASLRDALTYLRKSEHRMMVNKYGSDFRNTGQDVLVADPAKKSLKPIPSSTRQLLGQEHSTLNTLDAEHTHNQGIAQAMAAHLENMIPHNSDTHEFGKAFHETAQVGQRAPEGYKWVHKNMLGDLAKSVQPRSTFTKNVDKLNSAVTAATVYFKLSHIPQRTVTDATTSALSGALTSREAWKTYFRLRNTMTPKELNELAQSTGTHGYSALPHEDVGITGRAATWGANLFSQHIDSHFRVLNLIHEAQREGFKTDRQIRQIIRYAKNPQMKTKYAAQYEHILGRANRVSMMYDGLTAGERRTVARAFWFYPWTKAATRYAGHIAAEHPLTSAAGIAFGKQGEKMQHQLFGDVPSFEYGLVPFDHGKQGSNLGWLWPMNTASNVAEYGARPEQLVGNLNPVYGAALTAVGGPNQYGEAGQPHPLSQAADQLFSPTPEARILHDYLHQKQAEKKTHMFPHNWKQDFLTSLFVGPSYPKKVNKKALHFAAKKERGGFQDILVPKKR